MTTWGEQGAGREGWVAPGLRERLLEAPHGSALALQVQRSRDSWQEDLLLTVEVTGHSGSSNGGYLRYVTISDMLFRNPQGHLYRILGSLNEQAILARQPFIDLGLHTGGDPPYYKYVDARPDGRWITDELVAEAPLVLVEFAGDEPHKQVVYDRLAGAQLLTQD